MKRILLGALGSLGALLTAGLNHAWERPHYQRQYGARRQYRAAFKMGSVPTDKRHWHKPADPIQAARIEAAAVKRARRADKLQRDTAFSARNNDAWFTNGAMPARLNPIHS